MKFASLPSRFPVDGCAACIFPIVFAASSMAVWSSGMILASGARGPGLNSQNSPFIDLSELANVDVWCPAPHEFESATPSKPGICKTSQAARHPSTDRALFVGVRKTQTHAGAAFAMSFLEGLTFRCSPRGQSWETRHSPNTTRRECCLLRGKNA